MATPVERVEPRAGITGAQVAMLVGGLVVLLGLLWFFFLRGGGGEPEVALAPSPAPTVEAPGEDEGTEGQGRDGKGPVETFEVFAPKDPFDPVIEADTGTGAVGAVTDGVAGAGTPGDAGGPGTTPGTGDEPGGSNAPGGGGGGDSSVGGHTVRLIEVIQDDGSTRAQVQVDGTVFTVEEGEVFAESFQLLSVSGDCATMLFGDDQFTLCEGEEILK